MKVLIQVECLLVPVCFFFEIVRSQVVKIPVKEILVVLSSPVTLSLWSESFRGATDAPKLDTPECTPAWPTSESSSKTLPDQPKAFERANNIRIFVRTPNQKLSLVGSFNLLNKSVTDWNKLRLVHFET